MQSLISLTMMISAPMMMMYTESWMTNWMMLEISSISFISLMKSNSMNEGMMIYFLTQSFGSMMILMSMMETNSSNTESTQNKMMITLGITIKLGMIPFHQWFIKMGEMTTMKELMMLFTIQKAAPLIVLSWNPQNYMMMIIIMMSMMMSLFLQMSQTSMKMLLTYSSIFQTSWISMISMINIKILMMYYMIYSITLMMVMKEMKKTKTFFLTKQTKSFNINLSINMVSMSGIPPLLGFIPKWMTLKMLIKEKSMMTLAMSMIIMSVVSFFIYFQIFFTMWMKKKSKFKPMKKMKPTSIMQILIPILTIVAL
uniref:NADH-ubiquinone oxidoreductase chain 2 n=1 Tax=Walchia hayashii TaxID=436352 RepID=B3IUL2_9ACAR|nr:NADH dehydrogenase subunit 2 [Walchia hayashii]BAG24166.1 NADH dehydrogenase subunit 2 [Walchia hayashii]